MSDSVIASVAFPSLGLARSARDRLARAGFARNSIDIIRHDEDFSVAINTRPENKARAERILTGSPLVDDLRRTGDSMVAAVNGNRGLALGLAALAGFALFALTRRR